MGEFGPKSGKGCTMRGLIGAKVGHLSYNWAMFALSKGGIGPKVVDPRNSRRFQGWIWASTGQLG